MKRIIDLLRSLSDAKFWGELTIKFQDGVPVLLKKNEQIKVEDGKGEE